MQALPAPSRARAAGIRIGDEVLGVDGAAFERGVGLRHVAARIKASSTKVLTLRRGFAPVDLKSSRRCYDGGARFPRTAPRR